MTPEQIAAAWALVKPDDEPTQIVCTGEPGMDIWQPAFGTWEADDFGLNSDESVGIGERLFVNRGLYDAIVSALEAERAKVAKLVAALEHEVRRSRRHLSAKTLDALTEIKEADHE